MTTAIAWNGVDRAANDLREDYLRARLEVRSDGALVTTRLPFDRR